MFRFIELELQGWDLWPAMRVPLDGDIVILSGPNGSGKTTMLDAIRQILNATKLSQSRRLTHYLRHPNQPALVRAIVTNRTSSRGRRPFDIQKIHTEEATLACAIVPNGGIPEKRFAVLPGRVPTEALQEQLLNGRDWLRPEQYRRILDHAGVSRSLMHILALEQGRADELSRKSPRELYRWVMEARGSQQVLERYNAARTQYQDSLKEVSAQKMQVVNQNAELAQIERKVRRLDDYELHLRRLADAEALLVAADLAAKTSELRELERKLPELKTRVTNLVTTIERLGREVSTEEDLLNAMQTRAEDFRVEYSHATAERDTLNGHCAVIRNQLEQGEKQLAELCIIRDEDVDLLSNQLETTRQEFFKCGQQLDVLHAEQAELKARLQKLQSGLPLFPKEVQLTTDALSAFGIGYSLAATQVEIEDPHWAQPFESALGALRFAVVVAEADYSRSVEIADKFNFPGPITTSVLEEDLTSGPAQVRAGAPHWISQWLREVKIHSDGHRADSFGTWVSKVKDFALGGGAVIVQLQTANFRLTQIDEQIPAVEGLRDGSSARIEELETRIREQVRRRELPRLEQSIASRKIELLKAETDFGQIHGKWTAANSAVLDAERKLDQAKSALQQKNDDFLERSTDLEGARQFVSDTEARLTELQPDVDRLSQQCPPEMKARVDANEILISPEAAARDVQLAQGRLDSFSAEGPIPASTIREEERLVRRNIEELERHVAARQNEADAAREELDRCRGEYLNVIGSTLHDYRRRAYALADIARARLEIEIPTLENEDKSIDEAGIFVRIGFDGKPPTEIGDTAHSGGQQVIAGLILLMAMAETEGDSFFIVDEPFAHLSLDRVDEVGRFLRGSGSQFLITVPTTLDRGQLDPASLLIVLRKKDPREPFAPRPIVARV